MGSISIISSLRRRAAAALFFLLAAAPATVAAQATGGAECRGTLYLTLDTGTMSQAEAVAAILARHGVKATFFLANEATARGDHALDPSWAEYWRARAKEGHAFGSHTWRHRYLRADVGKDKVRYATYGGKEAELLDEAAFCREIDAPARAFEAMTGQKMSGLWRAPGGHTTPRSLAWAAACGYKRHVGWAPAGFLGDELPSESHPNQALLDRALKTIKAGDILMMHLGIRSRHDPFQPMLDPLIAGLKAKGFCFATLSEQGK